MSASAGVPLARQPQARCQAIAPYQQHISPSRRVMNREPQAIHRYSRATRGGWFHDCRSCAPESRDVRARTKWLCSNGGRAATSRHTESVICVAR
ncbi:hypothetical protein STRAU_7492 [Streptomyces aurantiacus JA 4570]|uniref:Uncharacterized protein n=1 Tax=Streptomyces aurantiacus JA 4570 TaxID=1286094 RepID=S3Z8H4_9ACTN|nr:hypothetical protein STRAU_7492 [Streptomyces aurantiacus JA 4570]